MKTPTLATGLVWSALLGNICPARASVLPDLDPMVYRMNTHFAAVDPANSPEHAKYFDAPIPKRVHQIWFGSPERRCDDCPSQWREFAQKFGYTYRLWTEADDAELQQLMPAENFKILLRLRACEEVYAASDLLRISLMKNLGGVYCDTDMSPPQVNGQIIDLDTVMPMCGMVLLTENFAMNVGNSAMFFANGLMMSAPNHPVFNYLESQLPHNIRGIYPETATSDDPMCRVDAVYATGPGFLSRSLAGTFTLLPITYARKLGMVHDGKWDAESDSAYTLSEIDGWDNTACRSYAE